MTAADWKDIWTLKLQATRITFESGILNLIRSCHNLDALEQIMNRSVLKSQF